MQMTVFMKIVLVVFLMATCSVTFGGTTQNKLFNKLRKKAEEKVDQVLGSDKQKKNQTKPVTVPAKESTPSSEPSTTQPTSKQNKTTQSGIKQAPMDFSDVITYKSPLATLKDIHIQAHQGLPRIGHHNLYYYRSPQGGQRVQRDKHDLLRQGTTTYEQLLNMKYSKQFYDDMDLNALTVLNHENKDNLKDIHSYVAQKRLLAMAQNLSTPETMEKYFCDPVKTRCMSRSLWSGTDEFDAEENYQGFIKENLQALRAWSETLFKKDQQTMYYVVPFKLPSYDFDGGGYWLKVPPIKPQITFKYGNTEAFFNEFLPVTDYGNAHMNRTIDPHAYYPFTLFKLDAEKAEALTVRKPESMYMVLKIVVVFKEITTQNGAFPTTHFTYHLASPDIAIYEDVGLSKRVGEISLITPSYKNN